MYGLKVSASFDSAHFLKGYEGKCANIHGHRWTVEALFSQQELQQEGSCRDMAVDFGVLKKHLRDLTDSFDHALIYEEGSLKPATLAAMEEEHFRLFSLPFRPTAERLAAYFYECLEELGLPVSMVTVYETPDNCAFYRREYDGV